jgi:histidine ammonia-lyase
MGIEDHGTSAPLSIRKADNALGMLEDVLAVELLLARDVLATVPERPVLGRGTARALQTAEDALADTDGDHAPAAVHRALRRRLVREIAGASAPVP